MKCSKNSFLVRMGTIVIAVIIFLIFVKQNLDVSVFNPNKELPIYSVDRIDKKIALTIDCAWGDEHTKAILDILDKYNIKATFFLVGFWVDEYPHQVEEIYKRGHEIGNHSTTHPNMSTLSKNEMINELKITNDKIKEIIGEDSLVFRPPFGDYNDLLIQTVRELNYFPIQWDVDSLDWKELGVEPVIDTVIKKATKGSIILFHNNAKYIEEYLPVIIETLQDKGYEMVSVSELIYKDNYSIDNSGKQIKIK